MNQSILFPDIQDWNQDLQAVIFPAQQAGALIECVATLAYINKLSGQSVVEPEQALQLFIDNRFEIEEQAEELIEEEEFNQQGQVELN
ncbi:DUF1488 domain-containing protein [Vibrio sp. LaRot3]|uniref:DUF1488 domain-containing protein n=1 Tax=Vibrio sp. LaRot3 TaxID=2998829 RepID=UPI0022CE19AD|nr:DUF1488 domain-containing protein [Vibrio sp. LaRot3]MDA0150661.1 DUF1488 domain-containing protein [Vibrio sp. LaRot3]